MGAQYFKIVADGEELSAVSAELNVVPNVALCAKKRGPTEFDVFVEADEPAVVSIVGRVCTVTEITQAEYEA